MNEDDILKALIKENCYDWILANRIKTEKGIELEFKDHKFLKDIYDDMSPIQVMRKASQIGVSVVKILKSAWLAKMRDYNVIYTLPTFSDVGQFVPSKVNAIIANNPVLQKWTEDKDSIYQKKFGKGFIYYRGTVSKGVGGKEMEGSVGIMFSSDLNVHDECDRSDQIVMEQYESRLEASKYQGRWYFSNPSVPNTLSQSVWEKSDQKHWFIKCHHCGKWQYLDYWKSVIDYQFICQYCKGVISDEDRREGQWVKKYKDRDISGYWIPHLICPWISAEKIQKAAETKTKQYFYNFVLGLPYIGSDIVVNKDIILRNIDKTEPNYQQHNVLGVDSGLSKFYVLGNKQGIFQVGMAKDWSDVEELIRVYDVEVCVIDALPDLTEPRKLRDRYPGKVWLNYYKKEIQRADYIVWDYKTHTVYSDRSKTIQQMIDDLINRKTRFQMDIQDLGEYVRHWTTLYKTTVKDNMDIERDIWESTGDDHYIHATNYFKIGLELSGETEVKEYSPKKKVFDNLAPDIKEELERLSE